MNSPRVESPYDGPVREVTIVVAGRPIKLVQPADPDRLLDAPEVVAWNADVDYMPYWAYLWPGALLLGEAVAAGQWPEGTEALEIGCGLGLSGLAAVASGLRVRFTDHDRTPLRFIEASARANGFDPSTYSTALLDWRTPPAERYPLILGADVTYERRLVPLVVGAIARLLEPGGVALLSDPDRAAAKGLALAAEAVGLALESTPAEAHSDQLGPVRGTIHRLRHRGSRVNPGSTGGSR